LQTEVTILFKLGKLHDALVAKIENCGINLTDWRSNF